MERFENAMSLQLQVTEFVQAKNIKQKNWNNNGGSEGLVGALHHFNQCKASSPTAIIPSCSDYEIATTRTYIWRVTATHWTGMCTATCLCLWTRR